MSQIVHSDVGRQPVELDPVMRQPQEFADIRASIDRIEELLEHGQSLLYDHNTGGEAVVSPTVSDGEPTLQREASFPSTTSARDDPKARKKERNEMKMTGKAREKVRVRPVGVGAVVGGRSRGGPPASSSLHPRRFAPRRRGTAAPSEDSAVEENVSLEELRRRIHAELEGYRRHGPVMQSKPQQPEGTAVTMKMGVTEELPRQRVERVNARRQGVKTTPVRNGIKLATPQTQEIAPRAPREMVSHGVLNDSNNRINNTSNHKMKNTVGFPNRSPNVTRDQHHQHRTPAWERLYDDAARIREKQRQRAIQQQREESNYRLKLNPYDLHSLRKRFSLKVTSTPTASNSKSQKESRSPLSTSVPAVTEKGRRGFDTKKQYSYTPQDKHQFDIPGRIFARRYVKPQETPPPKLEENEEEDVNNVNEPLHSERPAHTEADDPCVEENVNTNENEVQQTVAIPNVETETKVPINDIVKSPTHSDTPEEETILNHSESSSASSVRLDAASLASSDEVWELPLRHPREANSTPIPVIVRPLDLRALRK
ncbi:hypothetical protein LSM04_006750 [Trypanosoma melophagium]|uniref:uncharacterized protein n=1 Tax=Trypanosoma melophagium TaxID=715481 RepID=UPI00351A2852|nr:hypothetical protein LSM04_006750 [Trypanosoma melophagium]